ncbi:17723_t:CDS:2, partial [Dentiscutata erythropus]
GFDGGFNGGFDSGFNGGFGGFDSSLMVDNSGLMVNSGFNSGLMIDGSFDSGFDSSLDERKVVIIQ